MKRPFVTSVDILFLVVLLAAGSLILPQYAADGSLEPSSGDAASRIVSPPPPSLTVEPREIDLGLLYAGKVRRGTVVLRGSGSGTVGWTIAAPEGWIADDQGTLDGALGKEPVEIKIQLLLPKDALSNQRGRARKSPLTVQMILETGHRTVTLKKGIDTGRRHETIRLQSNGGAVSFGLGFTLVDRYAEPLIGVEPVRVDFGTATQGEQVSRRVRVVNQGWNTLKWQAETGGRAEPGKGDGAIRGRHVSFLNEEIPGADPYAAPRHLKDKLELRGKWTEEQGYPSAPEEGGTLRYRFSGTGISVYFRKGPGTGQLAVFLDDKFLYQQEGIAENTEKAEFLAAEGLSNGPHTLALVNRNAPVTIEGVRIHGADVLELGAANVTLSPDEGVLTRQTNYVNIQVDTRQLSPGHYGDFVAFDSNGGRAEVELSLDVVQDNITKILDVYRYVRDADYFFTTSPQAESATLQMRGYQKQGVAFRLFYPGFPGTTEFYRWFHPQREDHYYGYDLKSAKRPMRGYVLEGTIGNIATSRLTFTRALYRWYHPSEKRYFFTVDTNGEGFQKKGYQFDGIAGYVRP